MSMYLKGEEVQVGHSAKDSMYLTLWTLRASPLYVYRQFTLCLSPALDSIYYTLRVLASMFIVTLCLSSDIIYVLLKVATLPRVRALDHANLRKGLRGNLPESQKLQLYLAFRRSTTQSFAKSLALCKVIESST